MMRVRAPFVIRASEQRSAVVEVDHVWPGGECHGLVDGMTVPEPLEHLVVRVPIEVSNSSVDRVAVSNPDRAFGCEGNCGSALCTYNRSITTHVHV